MSDSSTARDRPNSTVSDPKTEGESGTERKTLERVVPPLAEPIRRAGFWTAIVIPFLYVPVLANGLTTWLESSLFLCLLVINVLALYVGHAYRR
ncbi:hypothetical protein [Natrarchaeobius chitinivorans]|nr:hypothetical protein [Natrarchaeobius chitinivorans]